MCSLIGHAPVGGGHYGTGSGLIFDIDCAKDANNSMGCSYTLVNDTFNCTHSTDAGVVCTGMTLSWISNKYS